ncbi:hypothetical protein C6W91_20820 [Phaeobacter sp. SYSU ZJ3003]
MAKFITAAKQGKESTGTGTIGISNQGLCRIREQPCKPFIPNSGFIKATTGSQNSIPHLPPMGFSKDVGHRTFITDHRCNPWKQGTRKIADKGIVVPR